jgi:hypothetical protein
MENGRVIFPKKLKEFLKKRLMQKNFTKKLMYHFVLKANFQE